MPRLTDKQRKLIIADYVDCGSYNAVAKRHKVSVNTVKKTVQSDSESAQKCKQKKEENKKDMIDFLESRKIKAMAFVDLALDNMLDPLRITATPTNQLATSMAIVIDKFGGLSSKSDDGILPDIIKELQLDDDTDK